MNVAIRAYRILKSMRSFKKILDPKEVEGICTLDADEECVGIYSNQNSEIPNVLVTSIGLHLFSKKCFRFVPFADISNASMPSDKGTGDDRNISITLQNGEIVFVPITGGHGRFSDIPEFIRFIDRVKSDTQ